MSKMDWLIVHMDTDEHVNLFKCHEPLHEVSPGYQFWISFCPKVLGLLLRHIIYP